LRVRRRADHLTGESTPLAQTVDTTYVAHLGGPDAIGALLLGEGRCRQWEQASDTLVLGDGATEGCVVAHVTIQGDSGDAACSIYHALQKVPDNRCRRGRRYPAAEVLTLLLLAKMAGEKNTAGNAPWVRAREELLAQ
jgi:hypothetical protein